MPRRGPFLDSSGLWAILGLIRNPLGHSRKLSLLTRRILSSVSALPSADFPDLPHLERDCRAISCTVVLIASRLSRVGSRALPCSAGKTRRFSLARSSPVHIWRPSHPSAGATLHSSPVASSHRYLPVLTVLASGVFRADATALSFATVRWHGFLHPQDARLRVFRCSGHNL